MKYPNILESLLIFFYYYMRYMRYMRVYIYILT